MEKINSVYAVENKIGGGMKNIERSKKEVNALHGEVSVFELNKPQPYEVFSSWPDDIQKEYLKKLYWTHGASYGNIADMLGVTFQRVADMFNKFTLPRRPAHTHQSESDKAKWKAFLNGKTLVKDTIPDETAKKLKEMVEQPVIAETLVPVKEDKPEELHANSDAAQVLLYAIEQLVHHKGAHVKIEITI